MNIFSFMQNLQKYLEEELKVLPLKYQERNEAMPVPAKETDFSQENKENKKQEIQVELPKPYPNELQQDFSKIRSAKIIIGSMPETMSKATSTAPFVLIQVMGGHFHNGEHYFTVMLRVCIYAEENLDAEADLHNLISLVVRSLYKLPNNILSKRYRLINKSEQESIAWERPDEQISPFRQAHIHTEWNMKGVQNESV